MASCNIVLMTVSDDLRDVYKGMIRGEETPYATAVTYHKENDGFMIHNKEKATGMHLSKGGIYVAIYDVVESDDDGDPVTIKHSDGQLLAIDNKIKRRIIEMARNANDKYGLLRQAADQEQVDDEAEFDYIG